MAERNPVTQYPGAEGEPAAAILLSAREICRLAEHSHASADLIRRLRQHLWLTETALRQITGDWYYDQHIRPILRRNQ